MITKKPLEKFPPGSNPYLHDSFHMGMTVEFGKSAEKWTVMHDSDCDYLIIVHRASGERVLLQHSPDNNT